jgi:hypothetical protein
VVTPFDPTPTLDLQLLAFESDGPNPPVANHIGNDSQNVWFEPYVAADPDHPGHYAVMLLDKDRTHLLVFVTRNSGASRSGPAQLVDGRPGFRDKPAIAFAPDGSQRPAGALRSAGSDLEIRVPRRGLQLRCLGCGRATRRH